MTARSRHRAMTQGRGPDLASVVDTVLRRIVRLTSNFDDDNHKDFPPMTDQVHAQSFLALKVDADSFVSVQLSSASTLVKQLTLTSEVTPIIALQSTLYLEPSS